MSLASVLGQLLPSSRVRFGKLSGVLSVNTQARRLGVLLYVLVKILRGKRLASVLCSPSAAELKSLKQNCIANGASSGYPTQTRSSIRHYLELARDLHLVAAQGNVYSLTSLGRLVASLGGTTDRGPYPLAGAIQRFFLLHVLTHDFFGMGSVISPVVSGVRTAAEIRARYRENLKARLDKLIDAGPDRRMHRQARDRLLGIASWKKPRTYAEHMADPRLHWLADLGLLRLIGGARSVTIEVTPSQLAWFQRADGVASPSWADVCELLDGYAGARVGRTEKGISPDGGDPCRAFARLFELMSRSRGVQKIRADVTVAFLLSSSADALEALRARAEPLFDDAGERACDQWRYSCHMAARATQAFVLRVQARPGDD